MPTSQAVIGGGNEGGVRNRILNTALWPAGHLELLGEMEQKKFETQSLKYKIRPCGMDTLNYWERNFNCHNQKLTFCLQPAKHALFAKHVLFAKYVLFAKHVLFAPKREPQSNR